jgi:CheY-like chemotaxis protein
VLVEVLDTGGIREANLGLAVARATVRAHGGEIIVRKRTGGGAVASIVLPAFEDGTSAVASRREEASAQRRRLLVAEDDPLVLRALTRVLARDFEIAAACNGREALDLVRAGRTFDAMLCDLIMPELSGIELHALLLREDPELARRTVFLTGGAFSIEAQSFLETAGQPHFEKPVDLKTVRDRLLELSED